jgi:hypothetical protein
VESEGRRAGLAADGNHDTRGQENSSTEAVVHPPVVLELAPVREEDYRSDFAASALPRGGHQSEPRDERRALLVLGPRGSEGFSPRCQATTQLRSRVSQRLLGPLLQLPLPDFGDAEATLPARLPEHVPEELALRGVDEGVGGKDLPKTRQRATRCKEQAAGRGLVTRCPQLGDSVPHGAFGEIGRLGGGAADEPFGRRKGPALGGVKWLPWRPA